MILRSSDTTGLGVKPEPDIPSVCPRLIHLVSLTASVRLDKVITPLEVFSAQPNLVLLSFVKFIITGSEYIFVGAAAAEDILDESGLAKQGLLCRSCSTPYFDSTLANREGGGKAVQS